MRKWLKKPRRLEHHLMTRFMGLGLILLLTIGPLLIEGIHNQLLDRELVQAEQKTEQVKETVELVLNDLMRKRAFNIYESTRMVRKMLDVQKETAWSYSFFTGDGRIGDLIGNERMLVEPQTEKTLRPVRFEQGYYVQCIRPIDVRSNELWLEAFYDVQWVIDSRTRAYQYYTFLIGAYAVLTWFSSKQLSKRLTMPLVQLESQATALANGTPYESKTYHTLELQQLQERFGEMAVCIQEQIQALEQESTNRKRFGQYLTHELRTPVTSIRGYSDLLLEHADNPDIAQKAVRHLRTQTERISDLSNRLSEWLSLTTGNLQVTTFPLGALLQDVQREVDRLGQVEWLVSGASVEMAADRCLLETILINLARNAVDANGGRVCLSITGKRMENGAIIEFADNGDGFPEEILESWRHPFHASETGGHGLGLSLCAELVERMNGSMRLWNDRGAHIVFDVDFTSSIQVPYSPEKSDE